MKAIKKLVLVAAVLLAVVLSILVVRQRAAIRHLTHHIRDKAKLDAGVAQALLNTNDLDLALSRLVGSIWLDLHLTDPVTGPDIQDLQRQHQDLWNASYDAWDVLRFESYSNRAANAFGVMPQLHWASDADLNASWRAYAAKRERGRHNRAIDGD